MNEPNRLNALAAQNPVRNLPLVFHYHGYYGCGNLDEVFVYLPFTLIDKVNPIPLLNQRREHRDKKNRIRPGIYNLAMLGTPKAPSSMSAYLLTAFTSGQHKRALNDIPMSQKERANLRYMFRRYIEAGLVSNPEPDIYGLTEFGMRCWNGQVFENKDIRIGTRFELE